MSTGPGALALIQNRGESIFVEDGFRVFNGARNIFLGSNIHLVDTLINAGDGCGSVTIEDDSFFGHGVKILARGHDYQQRGVDRQLAITEAPVLIRRGAWIASGAIILGGVTIGEHAVIGAGSVVTKPIPAGAIAAGNPARVVRYVDGFHASWVKRLVHQLGEAIRSLGNWITRL